MQKDAELEQTTEELAESAKLVKSLKRDIVKCADALKDRNQKISDLEELLRLNRRRPRYVE